MNENKNIHINLGGGFTGLLTIVFIVLKLCGIINWSWFWVFSPLIFSFGIGVIVVIIAIIFILLK